MGGHPRSPAGNWRARGSLLQPKSTGSAGSCQLLATIQYGQETHRRNERRHDRILVQLQDVRLEHDPHSWVEDTPDVRRRQVARGSGDETRGTCTVSSPPGSVDMLAHLA
jgi:hypothetical protein